MRRSRQFRSGIRLLKPMLLMLATASLSACGTDAPQRMGTGTASGAATGAAFGLIGGPIGVVIGGAIGGGIGALTASNTTPNQINLDNIGKSGAAPAVSADAQPGSAPQPGLRNQIDQYQAQPQQSGYGQPQPLVQTQTLAPPNPR